MTRNDTDMHTLAIKAKADAAYRAAYAAYSDALHAYNIGYYSNIWAIQETYLAARDAVRAATK